MKPKAKILVWGLIFFVLACGRSPVLNHDTAQQSDQGSASTPQTVAGSDIENKSPQPDTKEEYRMEFKALKQKLKWVWVNKPSGTTPGSFRIYFKNKNFLQDVILSADLFMPSMGHGSSPIKITSDAPGTALAENVFFTMNGAWDLIFVVQDKTKKELDRVTVRLQYPIAPQN